MQHVSMQRTYSSLYPIARSAGKRGHARSSMNGLPETFAAFNTHGAADEAAPCNQQMVVIGYLISNIFFTSTNCCCASVLTAVRRYV